MLTTEQMELAWRARDAGFDGLFYFAVRTTGIYCRPSCPSRPNREHIEFFQVPGDAVRAGYRPCKRCRPELADGTPPEWVTTLMQRVERDPESRITAAELRAMALTPEKARRWFQRNYGMTFSAWCRGIRLSSALTKIRRGEALDDVVLSAGFDSHSGFRDAFARTFGGPPGRARRDDRDCLRVRQLETPLGPMLAAASATAVCMLEFVDRRGLERSYAEMRRRFGLPVLAGDNVVLQQLDSELREYFAGTRREFSVPISMRGTTFQERVWSELRRIGFGMTCSYETLASRLKQPRATRAVARANGANRLYLIVPCHRVIAKDGSLSGYGGGVWRKRLLIELEKSGPAAIVKRHSVSREIDAGEART